MSPTTVEAVADVNNITWGEELTAVALELLHTASNEDYIDTKGNWVQSWEAGGWGASSDQAKCTEDDARKALYARGGSYCSMRDALQPLVETSRD